MCARVCSVRQIVFVLSVCMCVCKSHCESFYERKYMYDKRKVYTVARVREGNVQILVHMECVSV